jgi:hypothetical protein
MYPGIRSGVFLVVALVVSEGDCGSVWVAVLVVSVLGGRVVVVGVLGDIRGLWGSLGGTSMVV